MRATESGRSEAIILCFLFWKAEQPQGRLRLFGKCKAKGDQSDSERDGSDCKGEGIISTGWSFGIFGGWGHQTPDRRLIRPRRTRVGDLLRASRSKKQVFFSGTTKEVVPNRLAPWMMISGIPRLVFFAVYSDYDIFG